MDPLLRISAIVVALSLLGACSGDDSAAARRGASDGEPSPTLEVTAEPSPFPTATEVVEPLVCEDRDAVISDASKRTDVRSADVDGDGKKDGLSIFLSAQGEPGCKAFLVVAGGDASVPVWEVGEAAGLTEPTFNQVVDIDGDGDDEVVMNEAAGASTQFVGLFDFVEGALVRVEAPAAPDLWSGAEDGLFPTGGSVGHIEAVDCLAPGQIVVSLATPARERKAQKEGLYDLKRTLVSLSGGRLFDGGSEERTLPIEDVLALPEFSGAPFGSCGSA